MGPIPSPPAQIYEQTNGPVQHKHCAVNSELLLESVPSVPSVAALFSNPLWNKALQCEQTADVCVRTPVAHVLESMGLSP